MIPRALKKILSLAWLRAAHVVSTRPHVGELIELEGVLDLWPNDDGFVHPVLYAAGCIWELQGLKQFAAEPLQKRLVHVKGQVTRVGVRGFEPPAIQVHSLMLSTAVGR